MCVDDAFCSLSPSKAHVWLVKIKGLMTNEVCRHCRKRREYLTPIYTLGGTWENASSRASVVLPAGFHLEEIP